jgi:hypothetical protein
LLIDFGFAAKRIRDIPVFDFFGMSEEGGGTSATKIDDQVGVVPGVAQEGLGGKAFGGVAVVLKSLLGGRRDVAEREKAGAGGIDDIGGFAESDRFGHGAAAGVADANEEDAEYFGVGHAGIVAWNIEERRERETEKITQRKKEKAYTEFTEKSLRVEELKNSMRGVVDGDKSHAYEQGYLRREDLIAGAELEIRERK